MLRTTIVLAIAGVTAFAAPASHRQPSDDESRVARDLAGLTPGSPQSCIMPSHSQGGSHYGNVVLIRDRAGTMYRANFQGGCTADEQDTLVNRQSSTHLCRGDIVEIRDLSSGMFRGSCSYSGFVPYRRPR